MELERFNNRFELAKFFTTVSKDSGEVYFVIKYNATEGNIGIDKQFQQFAFEHSNNEYLAAIGLLLKAWEHYGELKNLGVWINDHEERLRKLESVEKEVSTVPDNDSGTVIKTF